VAEWIGTAALGFAVANEAVKSSSGDISWKLDEGKHGVLLPGGSRGEYQKENPKLTVNQRELVVSFWMGTKGS
jgi:ADP-dependent phosphofructokinase/glucokinase